MPDNVTAFRDFLRSVEQAEFRQFADRPGVAVANEAALRVMKAHILEMYVGVTVEHSFVDENGSVFDCIPVSQQPALRGSRPASPPKLPSIDAKPGNGLPVGDQRPQSISAPLEAGKRDRYDNAMSCPDGFIPMRRITLEEMARFETIEAFFAKSRLGAGRPPRARLRPAAAVTPTHRWAHAYQNVNNLGGHSYINVWTPPIGANQIFSLQQHWYVGGSGAKLQTAEVGWQVYPGKYGGSKPVFFIYWTADNYGTTGCYNLDCTAFVQTSSSWTIGGPLSPSSVYAGAQYEFQVAFWLHQGNWWLFVQGSPIGYYPGSLYQGGAMASKASEIDYGGETVGTTSFPRMGSGHFAAEKWTKACYQRDIYYFPTTGGAVYANLTPVASWPSCYTAEKVTYAAPWNTTIYDGGPGGSC